MLGYMCYIVRVSHRFKWPSWVVYDQNFRSEAADNGTKEWARIDPSLYAQCFMGQAQSEEAWCRSCHSLDYNSDTCPLKPPQPKHAKPTPPQAHFAKSTEVCRKYNRFGGDCHFGAKCKYVHAAVCATGRTLHLSAAGAPLGSPTKENSQFEHLTHEGTSHEQLEPKEVLCF